MKMDMRHVALVLCCALIAPVLAVGPGVARNGAASKRVDDKTEFRNAFKQAMSINSKSEMSRLVRKNTEQATFWIIDTAEAIAGQPNDVLFERMDALRAAWKDAVRTDFVNHMEKYYSLLDGPEKRERFRYKKEYEKKQALYFEMLEKKDLSKIVLLGNDFEGIARSFEQLRDFYFASQAWFFVAHCNDEANRGDRADLHKACEAYGKALEMRDAIELKDRYYADIKLRYDGLVVLGFGPAPEGGEAAPVGAKAAGTTIEAVMTYALVPDITTPARPNYFLDAQYPMWSSLSVRAKGSSIPIPRFDDGPKLLRVGSNDVQIDVDGDGKGDVAVPMRGKLEPVEFEIGEGDEKRTWSFLTVMGNEKDVYQGIEVNLQPTESMINLYYAPCASMVGDVAGTSLQVIDENLDGIYGNNPTLWRHVGLTEGLYQPEMDSIVVGGAKRALPWSEHLKVADQWYKLEIQNAGTKILALPMDLPTGELKLDFKGMKPDFVIVRGENKYENTYFDLASASKVEVPVGRYTLYYGRVSKGKKRQIIKAMILPGPNTPKWTVAEGETVEVTLGKPFGFDFKFIADDETVVIEGRSVVIIGSADERYERPWGCVPRPQASYRKAGGSRGSKPRKMPTLMSQEELYESGGFPKAWSPKDLVLEKKTSEAQVEVQLTQKKHKLFGKVESVWRQ